MPVLSAGAHNAGPPAESGSPPRPRRNSPRQDVLNRPKIDDLGRKDHFPGSLSSGPIRLEGQTDMRRLFWVPLLLAIGSPASASPIVFTDRVAFETPSDPSGSLRNSTCSVTAQADKRIGK